MCTHLRFRFQIVHTFFATLGALLVLTGCGTMPEVATYKNPLTGARTDILAENLLDTAEPTPEMIWLNAFRDFKNPYEYTYYLQVVYGANESTGLLDIAPGRTLTVIADGNELNFTGLGSLTEWEEKGAVFESARYEVSGADIERIANSKEVTVRVAGRNGLVVRQFGPENFEKFQQFVQQTDGAL